MDTKKILTKYGIDTSKFGKNGSKTLKDLTAEIQKGESSLQEINNRLTRCVRIVSLDVFYVEDSSIWRLYERKQKFVSGQSRKRKLPGSISEKLLYNETPLQGIKRALREEIGIKKYNLTSRITCSTRKVDSPSYPGLETKYKIFCASILIDPSEYKSEGYQEIQKNIITFFRWRKEKN